MSDGFMPPREPLRLAVRGKVTEALATEFPDLDDTICAVLDETDTVEHRDDADAWLEAARKKLNEAT